MSTWRFTAIDMRASPPVRSSGELAGESAIEVRASLRRVGLQVIDLRLARRSYASLLDVMPGRLAWLTSPLRDSLDRHLRTRRRMQTAELYDGLATMLDSGLPLLEAVQTVSGSSRLALRTMLGEVADSLHNGRSLDEAMLDHSSWFDASEVAMVDAGRHSGELPLVLRGLADRHQLADDLQQKLIGALAYPLLVALFGMAVVIFLSVRTLPDLAGILTSAEIEPPLLTRAVMAFGRFLAAHWLWLGVVLLAVMVLGSVIPTALRRSGVVLSQTCRRLTPHVSRRIAVANLTQRLAELIRTGVPVVEALRVLAPTVRSSVLREHLSNAADAVERGDELDDALGHRLYFDGEFTRLLAIGQTSGELPDLLDRIGARYQRQSRRCIDRLAALLEPVVILSIALLVGIVVMAVVLPLVQLQEIL